MRAYVNPDMPLRNCVAVLVVALATTGAAPYLAYILLCSLRGLLLHMDGRFLAVAALAAAMAVGSAFLAVRSWRLLRR